MAIPIPTRAARWASLAALLAVADATARGEGPPVEVLHGTKMVSPAASAAAPEPRVVPAGGAPAALPFVTPSSAEAPKAAPQTVVVIREQAPATVPTAPAAPTVVVVRESEPRPEPAPAARPTTDWLLAGAVAVALCAALVLRRPAAVVLTPAPVPPARPVEEPPMPLAEPAPETLTVGGLDAGPPPATAQKFDAGPTFQDEKKARQKQEAEQGAAVLEFILGQNLALRDALDADAPAPAHS